MNYVRRLRILSAIAAILMLVVSARHAAAQGVTTAGIQGEVKDAQGGVIPGASVMAIHTPSGTTYEGITGGDGRYFIPGMRVGGPYTVTATLSGFSPDERTNITLSLGVTQDVNFDLKLAGVSETVQVVAETSPVFSSARTGAATAVMREDLATLPTVSGRITDITRLSPQAGASGTFAGQDNRMNNITIDGSYFNNSFGLGGQPGDRTNVAPVSLEAVEQVQVSVAPYDVRQGNFVGAGVNLVTRSGTNRLVGSFYSRYRNQSFVGDTIAGQPYNRGTFTTKNNGGWIGGPIIKNKLFAFGSFEKQSDIRPLVTYRANLGNEPVTGSVTRVLKSDLDTLRSYLKTNFNYETGDYDLLEKRTPARPFSLKTDYNLSTAHKVTFRYSQLDSSTDSLPSGSNTAGAGRGVNSTSWLSFRNSTYSILENFKSGVGEWNSIWGGTISNNLTVGYTTNDESRGDVQIFPFIDILKDGQAYTSFGTEPNTPNNALLYNTFQAQDSLTKFMKSHSLTFGTSIERYRSNNVFFSRSNSVYVYNSLEDFYTDANGYLANKNRTTSPVVLNRFQVQYPNLVGVTTPPVQQLDAWYVGGYAQDQWRPKSNITITAGLRVDAPIFKNTAFGNPQANALTFRDQDGNAVRYDTGALPKATPLWSPRIGFNWDVRSNSQTQLRGGTGVFTGKPAYVWISNQIGNTGVLTGQVADTNVTSRPFNPDPRAYWVPGNGTPASSFELDVTSEDFKFPQTWRSNIALDHQLPGGLIGTAEFLYNRDLNGINYINANLPAPQSAFTGIDNRPRWVGASCAGSPLVSPCVNRINNANPQILQAFVLQNQAIGRSWTSAFSLAKNFTSGFSAKSAYSYGQSKNTVDAGSTAFGTVSGIATASNINTPAVAFSSNSPGHRFYLNTSYSKQYFGFGSTTVSAFFEAKTYTTSFAATNASYVFSGDMNGDGFSNNDLIYVPKDTSEMNFVDLTVAGRTFTAAQQAQAFEAYIQQDSYLSKHRGQYAERNGLFLPIVKRMDLSIMQEVFGRAKGRHAGQIRLDITNFGNLLNNNWGVGKRTLVPTQTGNMIPLLTAVVDANGKVNYRMATVNNELPTTTFTNNSSLGEVYQIMLSFRYNFN